MSVSQDNQIRKSVWWKYAIDLHFRALQFESRPAACRVTTRMLSISTKTAYANTRQLEVTANWAEKCLHRACMHTYRQWQLYRKSGRGTNMFCCSKSTCTMSSDGGSSVVVKCDGFPSTWYPRRLTRVLASNRGWSLSVCTITVKTQNSLQNDRKSEHTKIVWKILTNYCFYNTIKCHLNFSQTWDLMLMHLSTLYIYFCSNLIFPIYINTRDDHFISCFDCYSIKIWRHTTKVRKMRHMLQRDHTLLPATKTFIHIGMSHAAWTPQPHSINALGPVLISHPT